MPMTSKIQRSGLLIMILILGYMPFFYGSLAWWPHDRWIRILCGPVAVLLSAVLVGMAATRHSKWWLLSLIAPISGMALLLTASI